MEKNCRAFWPISRTDERYLEWSKAVGINFKKLDVVDKEDKISEIDASYQFYFK